ncbi:MAG: hypothetical protein JNL74_02270, partial [Fibrobacteres bacterium]|nr:hypothetical protein [Fibrobacterota bacterium]
DLIVALQCGLPFALVKKPYASFAFSSFSGGGADGYGDATIFSVGGGASHRWSEHLFSNGEAGVDIGSLEENSVFGLYARMGLNFKF